MMTLAIVGYAQSDIHFSTVKATDKNLPAEVIDALDLKMHQVLNRNSAAAADVYNVFAIEPALSANWCSSPRISSTARSTTV